MMSTYRIRYDDMTRESILSIVKDFSNDILINDVAPDSVGITIETDEAEMIYQDLLEEIDQRVYNKRTL